MTALRAAMALMTESGVRTVSSRIGLGKKKIDGFLYDADLGHLPDAVELLERILEIASAQFKFPCNCNAAGAFAAQLGQRVLGALRAESAT